jgi:hypothetical protein
MTARPGHPNQGVSVASLVKFSQKVGGVTAVGSGSAANRRDRVGKW